MFILTRNKLFNIVFSIEILFILFTSLNAENKRGKLNKYTTIHLATSNISKIVMIIQDSLGRKTGYDDSDGKYQPEEIPNSLCFIDGIADHETGDSPEEYSELIKIAPASAGVYKLIIKSKKSGQFDINLMAIAIDNSFLKFNIEEPYALINDCIFKGQIKKGEVKYFKLTYDPTPGSIVTIKEIIK